MVASFETGRALEVFRIEESGQPDLVGVEDDAVGTDAETVYVGFIDAAATDFGLSLEAHEILVGDIDTGRASDLVAAGSTMALDVVSSDNGRTWYFSPQNVGPVSEDFGTAYEQGSHQEWAEIISTDSGQATYSPDFPEYKTSSDSGTSTESATIEVVSTDSATSYELVGDKELHATEGT